MVYFPLRKIDQIQPIVRQPFFKYLSTSPKIFLFCPIYFCTVLVEQFTNFQTIKISKTKTVQWTISGLVGIHIHTRRPISVQQFGCLAAMPKCCLFACLIQVSGSKGCYAYPKGGSHSSPHMSECQTISVDRMSFSHISAYVAHFLYA